MDCLLAVYGVLSSAWSTPCASLHLVWLLNWQEWSEKRTAVSMWVILAAVNLRVACSHIQGNVSGRLWCFFFLRAALTGSLLVPWTVPGMFSWTSHHVSLSLSLSVSDSISFCLPVCPPLCLFLSRPSFIFRPFTLPLYLSLFFYLPIPLNFFFCLSLHSSLSQPSSLSMLLSLSRSLCVGLSLTTYERTLHPHSVTQMVFSIVLTGWHIVLIGTGLAWATPLSAIHNKFVQQHEIRTRMNFRTCVQAYGNTKKRRVGEKEDNQVSLKAKKKKWKC